MADPDAAHVDLRRLLVEHGPRLASRYQLSALGLAESPAAIAAIVARFDREPDLARFFALEAELAELAGRTVDLTPEAAHTHAASSGFGRRRTFKHNRQERQIMASVA